MNMRLPPMECGRPVSGTIVYPSIGSTVTLNGAKPPWHAACGNGVSNLTRGPAFWATWVCLPTNAENGPAGLTRPANISTSRQDARDRLLGVARESFVERNPKGTVIRQYNDAIGESQELMSGEFMGAFNLVSRAHCVTRTVANSASVAIGASIDSAGCSLSGSVLHLNFVNGTGWDT